MKDFKYQMELDDAIHRIRNAYEICEKEGGLALSFSGGKDSTIVAQIVRMSGLEKDIPLVFCNTGVELDATLRFVEEFEWSGEKLTIKPEKPLVQVMREYGLPALSKEKAGAIADWQRLTAAGRDPMEGYLKKLIGGGHTFAQIANKHLEALHEDFSFMVSNKCCHYLKKKPFRQYARSADGKTNIMLGVRTDEGGIRAKAYSSCFIERHRNGFSQKVSLPIIDWTEDMCDEFVSHFNIKLSDAYEVYGFRRTGCLGCPFSKTVEADLAILKEHEPKKYMAAISFFSPAYVLQDIKIDDARYNKIYADMKPEFIKMRLEMLERHRPAAHDRLVRRLEKEKKKKQ